MKGGGGIVLASHPYLPFPQMWMMPAFGTHPEFENGLEKDFYGYRTWFTIVNFGLPLGVFYRMHSVGGLVEVYLGA